MAGNCELAGVFVQTHTKVIRRLKHLIRKWAENEFKTDLALRYTSGPFWLSLYVWLTTGTDFLSSRILSAVCCVNKVLWVLSYKFLFSCFNPRHTTVTHSFMQ